MISVAAELTGMHPQTLRVYESKGLVNPQRLPAVTRVCIRVPISSARILINWLTDEGINLAGVVRILDMKERAEERARTRSSAPACASSRTSCTSTRCRRRSPPRPARRLG